MKRFIRYIGLFCCLLLLAIDALFWVYFFVVYINETHLGHTENQKMLVFIILILITILPILLILLLRKRSENIKKITRIFKKQELPIIPFDKDLNINIFGKLDYKDYKKLYFESMLKKRSLVTIIIILYFIIMVLSMITSESLLTTAFILPIWVLLCVSLAYLLIVLKIKRYYKSNKSLKEITYYHITNSKLEVTNDSSKGEVSWEKFYKVRETKTFILLYHDKIIFNYFDKRLFKPEELTDFIGFLKSLDIKKEFIEDK